MKSAVRWSSQAVIELERIYEYIGQDDATAAERWVTVLRASTARLTRFPHSERVVSELKPDDGREIVKVFESHRQFPADLEVD